MSPSPNLTLSATSTDDLRSQLRGIDITVPLVSEGRTKKHREQYMMARFFATTAGTVRLHFFLDVVHGEKPDFVLRLANVEVGVECVEAVPTEHHHIEDLRERLYPEAMNYGQHFNPGEENFTLAEKHEIASGQLAGSPWMPETAKRNWVAAMEYVVEGKTAKLRRGNYSSNRSTWLLVQDEWPNSLHFYPDQVRTAAAALLQRLAPCLTPPAFQAIFIACGNQMLCFQDGLLEVSQIQDLWK